ncbi:beta-galactosidase family protein [Chryseobacterium sp. JJR-5R]|uniref:glycoside hydrolase family 35 protein n=1 Tax=Chryseobacterium sp. JJR-5R TaxID=3093923 RepID=UPI002A759959|nr:beta-galactosidase family protein [Chryseobacterium sp. JJR-5R]WPO84366.1 beta-galactosidase family protein [Chryseobacterium sp. JJR-5R]
MNRLYAILCMLFFSCAGTFSYGQKPGRHTFTLGKSDFLLDGKPLQMISGEMHYPRIPRESWRDRMKMAKAMGLNTIGTYVFWNVHEETPGTYDFSGNSDIAEFVKTAREEGLWVVLRPSPYVCAEWEFGGYPWWLLKERDMKVRSTDPKFIAAYTRYIKALAKQLIPLQVTRGGNILMIQIENEYGSYSDDKNYMDLNRKIFREAGFDGILFTCDGAEKMPAGYLPGYLPAVNGLEDPAQVKALINTYHNGKGPYYVAEWYPGWFDDWGKKHADVSSEQSARTLDKLLAAGISVNMYMFHGGTTRGFMNGANMNKEMPYSPQVSSYDYDAPLDEAGNPTEKFHAFRKVIAGYLPEGQSLPPVPVKKPAIRIPDITLEQYADLFSQLPLPRRSDKPLSFEDLDQAYGFVLYRTRIKKGGLLKLQELRDYAQVYINGSYKGSLDRRLNQNTMDLTGISTESVLDLWVENNGRINYGPFLNDNRHGITESVSVDGQEISEWEMYCFPFKNTGKFSFSEKMDMKESRPVLYKGTFTLQQLGDTYLDMRNFGKGFVFLNGHNLGKYWNIGPQQTIYVPASWLRKGKNEVLVFDELKSSHTKLLSSDHPMLDHDHNPNNEKP